MLTFLSHQLPQAYKAKRSLFGLIHGEIVWRNVLAFVYLHYATLQALWIICTGQARLSTCILCKFDADVPENRIFTTAVSMVNSDLAYLFAGFAALGVTGGAHRLWTHNGYKAKWQLKVIWIYLNSMAFQNSVYEWARDHR